jgi:hypothetical protein
MNINQRLHQLESHLKPSTDSREPLLVKFIDSDPDTGEVIIGTGGILYVYDGVPATTYELDRKQLEAYEATGDYMSIGIDSVYDRSPNFRVDNNSKTERAGAL